MVEHEPIEPRATGESAEDLTQGLNRVAEGAQHAREGASTSESAPDVRQADARERLELAYSSAEPEESRRPRRGLRGRAREALRGLADRKLPEELRETNVWRENIELLENSGETGQLLLPWYRAALDYAPELAKVAIVPMPSEDEKHLFHATPDWESGNHSVHIRLYDGAVEKVAEMLESFPEAKRNFAKRLRMQDDELTPELALAFGVLHEFGHTEEYIAYEHEPGALRARNAADRADMPVPNPPRGSVRSPQMREHIEQNWDELSRRNGVSTVEELLQLQQSAHRNKRGELMADDFAAKVMMHRWQEESRAA